MQYLSSLILELAPFLANPDFQILIMAAMTVYLAFKVLMKSIKIFAATIKAASVIAALGLIVYLFTGAPESTESREGKRVQTVSPANKVGKTIALIKHASRELPTFVADLRASIKEQATTDLEID